MNQNALSHSKNKSQRNNQPSHQFYSLKRQTKSKPKPNNITSKSFSESFLKQYSSRRSANKSKQQKLRVSDDGVKQISSKNKKMTDHNISNATNKDQKKKILLLNALDKKSLKDSIKVKTQAHKTNITFSNNFKYGSVQKNSKPLEKNNLKLSNNHNKNKSQSNLFESHNYTNNQKQRQKNMIKSISSTAKNQQLKNRLISHLDNKNKRQNGNQLSLSQRKKLSQKLQNKLNQIQSSHFQEEKYLHSNKNKQNFISQRTNLDCSKQKHNQKKLQKNQVPIKQSELDRLQFKFAFRTRKGQHINNPKKVNQDSILVKQNISKKDLHMIAVADGHGPSGHFVSQFVIKALSKHFSDQINQVVKYQQQRKSLQRNNSIQSTIFLPKIYDKIQTELSCSQINSATSGCTLVNVILQKKQILCANVGDSRAILARQMDKKNWELIYLSEDHKPQSQSQKKRILKSGGRIHTFKGEHGQNLGPLRVWLPNQNIQGLAMTRSFGDNISKSVGVTHKPEMIKVKIDEKDKFILVASDGVWQFISNQQILQLIAPYYKQKKLEQACDALLKLSYERWTQGDDSVVDDISFVLLFLNC